MACSSYTTEVRSTLTCSRITLSWYRDVASTSNWSTSDAPGKSQPTRERRFPRMVLLNSWVSLHWCVLLEYIAISFWWKMHGDIHGFGFYLYFSSRESKGWKCWCSCWHLGSWCNGIHFVSKRHQTVFLFKKTHFHFKGVTTCWM